MYQLVANPGTEWGMGEEVASAWGRRRGLLGDD